MLLRCFGLGFRPITDILDPVIWSPREYNGVADHAANASMDLSCSWERVDEAAMRQAFNSKSNLRLCVDGGLRSRSVAATGLALYEARLDQAGLYQYHLLSRKGRILTQVTSAFIAETLALEWALEYILKVIERMDWQ